MIAAEAEEIVRKVWEGVKYNNGKFPFARVFAVDSACRTFILAEEEDIDSAWLAAHSLTLKHMRKIAEKVRDRKWLEVRLKGHSRECGHQGCTTWEVVNRLLRSNKSELAALRRGVRKEYQDGSMEGL